MVQFYVNSTHRSFRLHINQCIRDRRHKNTHQNRVIRSHQVDVTTTLVSEPAVASHPAVVDATESSDSPIIHSTLRAPELSDVAHVYHEDSSNGGIPPSGGNGNNGDDSNGDNSNNEEPNPLSQPLTFLLRGIEGRLAADPFFAQKLLVECGLDAIIIISVNIAAKKELFLPQIEFTFCQLAISLLSDFALVYLLAPSSLRSAAKKGSLRAALEALPSHVFQSSPSSAAPYTLKARLTTFLVKGMQYGGVGYTMGCLGAASVQALLWLREFIDPHFEPPSTVQSIPGTGLAWSGFMATSSNLRYNLVNGLEDLLYRRSSKVGLAGSTLLRLLNNWAGAVQWVMVTDKIDLDVPWKVARSSSFPLKTTS